MDFGINQSLVEDLYLRFRENPHSVDSSWRKYFERLSDAEQAALLQTNGPAGARYVNGGGNGAGVGNGHTAVARSNGAAPSNGTNGAGNGHGHAGYASAAAEYGSTTLA